MAVSDWQRQKAKHLPPLMLYAQHRAPGGPTPPPQCPSAALQPRPPAAIHLMLSILPHQPAHALHLHCSCAHRPSHQVLGGRQGPAGPVKAAQERPQVGYDCGGLVEGAAQQQGMGVWGTWAAPALLLVTLHIAGAAVLHAGTCPPHPRSCRHHHPQNACVRRRYRSKFKTKSAKSKRVGAEAKERRERAAGA